MAEEKKTDSLYSQEAEEATIGAVIMDSVQAEPLLKFLQPDKFFIVRHQYIWSAIDTLHKRGVTVDYLTLAQQLKDCG